MGGFYSGTDKSDRFLRARGRSQTESKTNQSSIVGRKSDRKTRTFRHFCHRFKHFTLIHPLERTVCAHRVNTCRKSLIEVIVVSYGY